MEVSDIAFKQTSSKHARSMKTTASLYLGIASRTEILHFTTFFFFKACRYKEKHSLVPCHVGGSINATECLENRCCPSKGNHELKCYIPFKDGKYSSVNFCFIAKYFS